MEGVGDGEVELLGVTDGVTEGDGDGDGDDAVDALDTALWFIVGVAVALIFSV